MSFASLLNSHCSTLHCTNREIAECIGIAPSTLSRYRHGERVPEPGSLIVTELAECLAQLWHARKPHADVQAADIRRAFEKELASPRMAGMDFNMRLDTLMDLLSIRNADFAEVCGVDPSYVSRIRRGQRMPANLQAFAGPCSHLAAHECIEKNMVDQLGELVGISALPSELAHSGDRYEADVAEVIEVWLTGSQIFEADIAHMESLFKWLDNTDFSEWISLGECIGAHLEPKTDSNPTPNPVARFYYGIGGMRNAELAFLNMAAETECRNVFLSSDMPLLKMDLDSKFVAAYRDGIATALRQGSHVDVIYNVERPLEETLRSLRLWIPLYMTGRVAPHYLRGVNDRLFCHVNYVCDTCALSSEAVMGHQGDGRYYFTTRPEDVSYYRKKMGFILEKTSSIIEIYRECDDAQRREFLRAEQVRQEKGTGRCIGENRYENLRVMSYPGDCTVLSIACSSQPVHLVIRHPKINYIVARMK